MAKWIVEGTWWCEVEADSREEAMCKADPYDGDIDVSDAYLEDEDD